MSDNHSTEVSITQSLQTLLSSYLPGNQSDLAFKAVLAIISHESDDFLTRSKAIDKWITENPAYEELSDALFDLLMVRFLSLEAHVEDYFESQEWAEIENKTIDKGSEMLTLFLYLSEAKEADAEIGLEDFLKEFLFAGEEEGQDEYRIYESLIVNEDILDANIEEIREIGKTVNNESGLREYFPSFVLFFQYVEGLSSIEEIKEGLSPFEVSALNALIAYHEN